MTYELINIGRGKFNGRVEARDEFELIREVKKHLASRFVDIDWDGETGIVTAGFHTVGMVRRIQDKGESN